MAHRMKNIALTGCLALGIALSPAARPAQALDGAEALGLIIGLGALAAIARELKDDDDHRAKPKTNVTRNLANHGPVFRPVGKQQQTYKKKRRVLPRACLREVRTPRGEIRALGRRCLRNHEVRVGRLPSQCRFEARNGRVVFAARCLRRNGYEFGRLAYHDD